MKKIHSIWKLFVGYLHKCYMDYYIFKKELHICDSCVCLFTRDTSNILYLQEKNGMYPQV